MGPIDTQAIEPVDKLFLYCQEFILGDVKGNLSIIFSWWIELNYGQI